MRVVVACDKRFTRTPDGQVWTDGVFPYAFWTRYLSAFDSVRVVARVRDVHRVPAGYRPSSGCKVAFAAVPDYQGPFQYMLRSAGITAVTAKAVETQDAVILRVPSRIGTCVEQCLRRERRPYGVEVVGDPYDVFAPGAVRHPFRVFFRYASTWCLRLQCRRARVAAYVTESALQRRYPPGPEALATHYSDVELPPDAFVDVPRSSPLSGVAKLIFVGTLEQLYKAPDVLIDAVASCLRDGLNIELVLVGSGRYQSQVKARAVGLGLNGQVQFRGRLTTPEAVRAELDQAHLFVLPSRQEGLPRAMIEAMARALPCIGSNVGGIPELLPAQDTVPPNDAPALARKIHEVLRDPNRMARMSARNLAQAREYTDVRLSGRRQAFYTHLRVYTEAWLQERR